MASSTQYAIYPEFSNTTIIVTTTAELTAAINSLSAGTGGTILVDGSAGTFQIEANNLGTDGAPVLIQPLDPNDPPVVEQVDIYDSSHLTITGMEIDSSAIADIRHVSITDVNIYNSNDIQFVGNVMDSTADAMWTQTNPPAESAITIRNCQDIDILDNVLTDYKNGIVYLEVTGLNISGNDISGIQGDGLKGGGIQDVVISNNYIHDFYGATQDVNHSDMIQIFGSGRTIVTNNVEIYGNILDNGDGAATQGIFIRNEDWQDNGFFQNISIHDNAIYTAMPQGIGVNTTDDVEIYQNTVLWSENATYLRTEGDVPLTAAPRIIVANSTNATVIDNLVGDSIVLGQKLTNIDNYIIDYTDSTSAAYVTNHLVNFFGDGQHNLTDLQILSTSSIYGIFGAPMSWDDTASTGSSTLSSSTSTVSATVIVDDTTVVDDTSTTDTSTTDTSTTAASTDTAATTTSSDTTATDTSSTDTTSTDTTTDTSAADTTTSDTSSATDTASSDTTTDTTSSDTTADTTSSDTTTTTTKSSGKSNSSKSDDENFLAKIFHVFADIFTSIFGGGSSSSADTDTTDTTPVTQSDTYQSIDSLADIPTYDAEADLAAYDDADDTTDQYEDLLVA